MPKGCARLFYHSLQGLSKSAKGEGTDECSVQGYQAEDAFKSLGKTFERLNRIFWVHARAA